MNNLSSDGEDSDQGSGFNVLKKISKRKKDERQQLIAREKEENNAQVYLNQSNRVIFASSDEFMNNVLIKNPISQS